MVRMIIVVIARLAMNVLFLAVFIFKMVGKVIK